MTRATLGHTGRRLNADRWAAAIYSAVSAAAAARICASFLSEGYVPLLWAAGLLWIIAFGLYVARFCRMFVRP